ncbi:class I lanthipeptide [Mucilaginibacter sp.]|uniref:class I lanthipeptide n=1 Tax=Mucilaginibacter sp. TaxID=1882438 RepID=UPI0025D472D7|nr:class I lanthipeptide [Mucilaginibacter sp.]
MEENKSNFNPIRIGKKLKLNKETVSRLQAEQMEMVIGGDGGTYTCPSGTCPSAVCSCGGISCF